MARTAKVGVVRRNVEFYPETAHRLDTLRTRIEATSDTEVVRRALKLLEELISDQDAGRQLYVRQENGELTAVRMY